LERPKERKSPYRLAEMLVLGCRGVQAVRTAVEKFVQLHVVEGVWLGSNFSTFRAGER